MAKKVVVIDPGHGGKDPGAVAGNVQEKDINLRIAAGVYVKLLEDGYKVKMTRTNDSFIRLYDRAAIANDMKADVFISIHNNSAGSKEAGGTETLYYPDSKKGKTLAGVIQSNLVDSLNLDDRDIKERKDLAVLKYTAMPAVLVECAFISNPKERKLLQDKKFRYDAADAIYEGINNYFEGG